MNGYTSTFSTSKCLPCGAVNDSPEASTSGRSEDGPGDARAARARRRRVLSIAARPAESAATVVPRRRLPRSRPVTVGEELAIPGAVRILVAAADVEAMVEKRTPI